MAVGGRPDKIGKYEIVDDIGGGGMGKVYKARDPRMRRTVAIKVIKGDFSAEPEFLKRFDIEAQALASLVHPNIVVVHDLGDEQGSPYLVMEYLDGTPLDKIIAQRQNVPLVQKLGIVIDVLNALHYAHQHEIIHRDVKPPNVMVLKTGIVKLLDFGIAREGDTGGTKTGLTMGTEWYMSPEQLNSEVADARSDIYAAGILLYEVLAYTLPFDPRDRTGMIVKRLRGDPPPPLSKYLESYPPELDEIIARALAANRENRYSTAEEFAFELARVQDRLKRDMVSHYVSQARESIARSDLTKARQILSEVIRLDTQNQTAKQLLYEIQQISLRAARKEKKDQLRDQAAGALAAKQLEAAEKFAEEAIRLDANDTDLLNLREQIELAKGRTEQVKKLLALANMAQQTGQLDMAKRAVDDALALDPQHTDAKLMGSAIARLMIEYERQHEIQQFLQAARREIEARQFAAAQENIAKAKAIDPAYPEIAGLERMFNAGREQEARQRELAQLCKQIEQELGANKPKAARDIASNALRKYPGEPSLVKLRTAADIAVERHERQAYIEERIATASRLVDGGEASRGLALLKDAERDYPTDTRLREYVQTVREAVVREAAAREKQTLLQKARNAMRGKSFAEAISVLESGLVQFPEDAEIKDLLKTARDEFHLLSKKKQVDDVSKQAQELLQSRAHTDAIRLLERTSAQVSDPELAKLLEYARNEAARFRTGLQEVSEQASNMLNLGQHSEAVTFLEAHADKYGKNADFQVLLEQARNQAEGTRRAKARLQTNLKDARAKLRMHDTYGAEALLHLCEREASDDPDVMALAVEIEEEKKAEARRQAEAAEQASQDEERWQKEAAERELEPKCEHDDAAKPQSAFDKAGATRLLASETPASPHISVVPQKGEAAQATALAPDVCPAESPSATALFSSSGAARTEQRLEPAEAADVIESFEVVPKASYERKESKRAKEPEKKAVGPLRMETVLEPSTPISPAPAPPLPQPVPRPFIKKRLIAIVAVVIVSLVVGMVIWKMFWPKSAPTSPGTTGETKGTGPVPQQMMTVLNITGAPPNATYHIGDQSGTTDKHGAATVKITSGNYSLDMDAAGYKPFSKTVQLEADKPATILAEMDIETPGTEFGTLVLKASAPDYRVFVGDRAPVTVRGTEAKLSVPVGTYRVHITKTGYDDSKPSAVKITANAETKISLISLKELPPPPPAVTEATLSIQVRPLTAKIQIDGSSVPVSNGSYSGEVSPASHSVVASAEGYRTQTKPVTPKAGENVTLSFELDPNPSPPPPASATIELFEATPSVVQEGEPITLKWKTVNANKVSIDAIGDVGREGHLTIPVSKPTTYVLTATGPDGKTVTDKATVEVRSKPTASSEEHDKVSDLDGIKQAHRRFETLVQNGEWDKLGNVKGETIPSLKKFGKVKYKTDCAKGPEIKGDRADETCAEALQVLVQGTFMNLSGRGIYRLTKENNTWSVIEWTHGK